jgi:hypothetical protein
MQKKKIWANFQRIVEVFTQKIFNMLSNIWVWDPGSGKNLFRIPDPGVETAPDPRSGSATLLNTRRLIARIPGCASPWMVANTAVLKAAGTSGRANPVETSHRTSAPWIRTRRTCRAGLAATFCTSDLDPATQFNADPDPQPCLFKT